MTDTTADNAQNEASANTTPAWMTSYPARYYVSYDHSVTQPAPPTGWYDMSLYQSLDGFPDAADMIALTPEEWISTPRFSIAIKEGKLVAYIPAPPVIPLTSQAASALSNARAFIYNNYGILNEATPDAWVTYLKALMAIANGTDTTSTALPTAPAS